MLLHFKCKSLIMFGFFWGGFDFLKKKFYSANMASLINCARQKGKWDFTCRSKQMALITCLEDSTNEVELH